jgi:2Fe-2S ferredoxin
LKINQKLWVGGNWAEQNNCPAKQTGDRMSVIKLIDKDGSSHILDAVEGWRVMEIIREHGFDVGGLCGGACSCATCHVEVDGEWAERLVPANDDEEAMLDEVPAAGPASRLSCQIIYSPELEGLTVKLVAND